MPSDILDTISLALDRTKDKRPTEAIVHGIDGDRVDVRLDDSVAIIRHVRVVGSVDSISVGDSVQLQWTKAGRPIVMLSGSGSTLTSGGRVTTDNQTIENSSSGLRVKRGGIERSHLAFDLPDESEFVDLFAAAGWQIDPITGTIYHNGLRLVPSGEIALGTGDDVIKISSYGTPDDPASPEDDTEYRLWVGNIYPYAASFAIKKDGYVIAREGNIGGWELRKAEFISDDGNAVVHAGARPFIGLGGARNYLDDGFWVGKDTDYIYKVSIGSSVGGRLTYDGSNLTLENLDLNMYNGSNWTLQIAADGNFTIGADIDTVSSTSMKIFTTDQTWDSEAFTAGDILIGDHGGAHVLWDQSSGQLQFRDGSQTGIPVQVYIDTDGSFTAGSGTVTINDVGLRITDTGVQAERIQWGLQTYIIGTTLPGAVTGDSYGSLVMNVLATGAEHGNIFMSVNSGDEEPTWGTSWGIYGDKTGYASGKIQHSIGSKYGTNQQYTVQTTTFNSDATETTGFGMRHDFVVGEVAGGRRIIEFGDATPTATTITWQNRSGSALDSRIVMEDDHVQILDFIELHETSEPAHPGTGSGHGYIYLRGDMEGLFFKDDGGVEYNLTSSALWTLGGSNIYPTSYRNLYVGESGGAWASGKLHVTQDAGMPILISPTTSSGLHTKMQWRIPWTGYGHAFEWQLNEDYFRLNYSDQGSGFTDATNIIKITATGADAGTFAFNPDAAQDYDFIIYGITNEVFRVDSANEIPVFSQHIEIKEMTIPSTSEPASGYGAIYADTTKLYYKNDSGTTYDLTLGSGYWTQTTGVLSPSSNEDVEMYFGSTVSFYSDGGSTLKASITGFDGSAQFVSVLTPNIGYVGADLLLNTASSGDIILQPVGSILLKQLTKLYSSYDLVLYSDAGTTEVARIDGATGNITTSGTVDGVDIAGHAGTQTAHWTVANIQDLVGDMVGTGSTQTGITVSYSTGGFLDFVAEWSESGGFLTQTTGTDIVQIQNWLELEELGTGALPTTGEPGTGFGALYVKSSDGKIYFKNDGGTEYDLTSGGGYWSYGSSIIYPNNTSDVVVIGGTSVEWSGVIFEVDPPSFGSGITLPIAQYIKGQFTVGKAETNAYSLFVDAWTYDPTNNISNMHGLYLRHGSYFHPTSLSKSYGAKIEAYAYDALTTAYDLHVGTTSVPGGSISTHYGLYVKNDPYSSTFYSVYTEGGKAVFNFGMYDKDFEVYGDTALAFSIDATYDAPVVSGYMLFSEQASSLGTGLPPTNYGALYGKTDGHVYYKNDSGTEFDLTDTTAGSGADILEVQVFM